MTQLIFIENCTFLCTCKLFTKIENSSNVLKLTYTGLTNWKKLPKIYFYMKIIH